MIVITFQLRRRAELSAVEFHEYWRDRHGPLVASQASALGIRRYMQLHATDSPVGTAIVESRGCAPQVWDGIAVVWFDSEQELGGDAATAEDQASAAALLEDERRFLDLVRCELFISKTTRSSTERHICRSGWLAGSEGRLSADGRVGVASLANGDAQLDRLSWNPGTEIRASQRAGTNGRAR